MIYRQVIGTCGMEDMKNTQILASRLPPTFPGISCKSQNLNCLTHQCYIHAFFAAIAVKERSCVARCVIETLSVKLIDAGGVDPTSIDF